MSIQIFSQICVKQITRCSLRYEQRCHRMPFSRDCQGGMSSFDGSHPRAQGQLYIRHSNLVVIATKYMKIHEHTAYPVRYLWQITLQISQVCKFSFHQIWIVWGLHDSTAWIQFFAKWWETPVVLMEVILNLQPSLSVFFSSQVNQVMWKISILLAPNIQIHKDLQTLTRLARSSMIILLSNHDLCNVTTTTDNGLNKHQQTLLCGFGHLFVPPTDPLIPLDIDRS